jgi:hypothetical protein
VTVISDLMSANLLTVFSERDESRRMAAMAELYAADATFSDHDGVVSGIDAISGKVHALLDRLPGFVFSEAGPVYEVQELGSVDWNFGAVGQAPAVSGTDVVTVADGKIATLHAYLRTS